MSQPAVTQKALALLAHPASLAAMGIMLLNDLFLRRFVPSWWTGKISDFAYLFFMPFVLAALLGWLAPGRWARRESRVRALAFAITGLAFSIGKLFPAVNALASAALQSLLGFPLRTLPDPTDLLALPALAAAWLLWQRRSPALRSPSAPHAARWLLLPLAAFLTLANSAPPSSGVVCLALEGDRLIAGDYYTLYQSADGGLTWQKQPHTEGYPGSCSGDTEKLLKIPATQTYYRFDTGVIQQSLDAGATWQPAYRPPAFPEAEQAYLEKTASATRGRLLSPAAAVYHPQSGNVLFAMGIEGVLIRLPDGQWRWAAVGPFFHRALEQGGRQAYFTLLQGELLLSLAAALAVFSTLAFRLLPLRWYRSAKLALAWGLFALSALLAPPAITNGAYADLLAYFAVLAAALWGFLSALADAIALARRAPGLLARIALFSLGALPAFFLPYALWAFTLLPHYRLATLLAAILLFLIVLLARRRLPSPDRPAASAP